MSKREAIDSSTTMSCSCSSIDSIEQQQQAPLRPSLTKHQRTYQYGGKSTTNKSVSFGTIECRTFETIRGHVKIEAEYPLMLGWTCVHQSAAISVDDYETENPSEHRPSTEELLTHPKERKKMLNRHKETLTNKVKKMLLVPRSRIVTPRSVITTRATANPRSISPTRRAIVA